MPSSPKSQVGRLKALPPRTPQNNKKSNSNVLRDIKDAYGAVNKAYGSMLKNQPVVKAGQASAKAGAKVASTVAKGAAKRTAKDIGNVAQFGSNQAKTVIREAQGLAKMVLKGFGN